MMTEEELRKKATSTVEWESTPMIDRPLFVHAYITGAKPREKQIEEQKVKIAELELKIKYLTEHLEPQTASALFKQVEEEVEREQKLKEFEEQIEKMRSLLKEIYVEYGFSELVKIRNDLPTEIQEVINNER